MEADWEKIEDGLIAWVERTANLPGKVIWDQPNVTRPPRPFATLRHDGHNTLGLNAEQSITDNGPAAPSGEELTIETSEHTEFTLTVSVFTAETSGPVCAFRLAKRVRSSAATEETINSLDSVGLALIDRAPVMNVSDMLDTDVEGQATFDVRFRFADGTDETATFIETASATGSVD